MTSFSIDMTGVPADALRSGPEIGDVYKKDGGPAGFMVIVSDNGSSFGYLAVAPDGRVTGVGQGNAYYFSRRCWVGRVVEFPALAIHWETHA